MSVPVDFDDSNHLKAWREFRGLNQEQLAELADTTAPMISHLENGKRQLTTRWLRRLGSALRIPAGFILDRHPDEVPHDVLALWEQIPEGQQSQAIRILETFKMAS